MMSDPISTGEFRSLLNRLVLWPALVVGVFAALLAWQNLQLQATAARVDHTDVVIAHLTQMTRLIIDEETGARGYLLNRDSLFLEPFTAGENHLPALFSELHDLLSDNPVQLKRLRALEAAHDQWLAFTKTSFRAPLNPDEAHSTALEGKRRMDAIRQMAAEMLDSEEGLRYQRVHRAELFSRFGLIGLVLLAAGAAVLIAHFSRASMIRLTARYRAMNATIASEREWFRMTLRGIGDAVIACDADGRVTLMNHPAEQLTGWSEDEARHKIIDEVFKIVAEDTREPAEIPVNRVLRNGDVVALTNHTLLLRRDGTEVPIDDSGAPIRDDHGNITGVVLVFRDVSEDRRREQERAAELGARERMFRELAESIPQLAWMAHPDGHLFWYNRRWYDYTGTTPEQMEGWGWRSVHDPHALPRVESEWRKCIATSQPFEMVFPLKGADGKFRPFLTRSVPMLDDDGQVVRWFGTNTDISSEREVTDELRTSRDTLRIALDASNTGTFRWDAENGTFLEVGQNLKRLFGIPQHQTFVRTEDFFGLVHRDDLAEIKATLKRARTADEFAMEFRVIHPDQSVHWLYDRAKRQTELPGRIFVGACTDVTQRKLAEDTLRRTEKLAVVGRMASSISHEINNPLAAVTNLMFLIQCAESLEQVRAFAETAETELARVSQIVTQTLRFHRSAARPTRFNVAQLLESAVALYQPHIAASGVTVEQSLAPDATIYGNDGELRQVFLNLIGNGLDAIRGSGSRLVVRERLGTDFRTGQRGVRITIADDGHGMDESTARRIFEPFFSTKGESGTGLGLWISQEIVRKHNGSIRLRSSQQAGAHGTVFSVFIPFGESSEISATSESEVEATA